MSIPLIAIPIFLALFLALAAVTFYLSRSPNRLAQRLESARADGAYATGAAGAGYAPLSAAERLIMMEPADVGGLRMRLAHAGIRGRHSVLWYYVFQFGGAAALALVAFRFSHMLKGDATLTFLFMMIGAVVGYLLPPMFVTERVSRRRDAIRRALPNVLDLVIVCVEAGLGLNAAVQRIALAMKNTHRELAEELNVLNQEIFVGKGRAEAFRNMALRTGVDELRTLATVLMQSDRMGTSVADVLRVQARTMRIKRRQLALEDAHKMPVKLVFPLVLCIFPEILVVLLGPGGILFYRTLVDVAR